MSTTPTAGVRSGRSGSQSIDRACALLDAVVSAPEPRSYTSLVAEFDLARSTTSRLLSALERNNLVQRDRSGSYRPGALFAVYAAQQNPMTDLAELVHPFLEVLAEETGETATFGVPRGEEVVQVDQADGRYLLGTTNWLGVDVPAHCSAVGKVLLAFGRLPIPSGPMPARTPATITSPARLQSELSAVRTNGWASTWEELEPGLTAIAAPVRSPSGSVIGAVAVSGPTARISRERTGPLSTLVLAQAAAVSAQLGSSRKVGAA